MTLVADSISERLLEAKIHLSPPVSPLANYISCVRAEAPLVFVSGQGTRSDGTFRYIGKVGDALTVEEGYDAARLCAVNILNQLESFCGLENVIRVVKLTGFVNAAPSFVELSKVLNGASDLMVQVWKEAGRHTRSAVGVATLPAGMAVEVEGIFAVRDIGKHSPAGPVVHT